MGFIMWLRRLAALKKTLGVPLKGSILLRAMISVAIDSDEPFYTIVSFSAFSFIFLGGLQLDYVITFSVMLGFFGLSAFGDSVRVLLAYQGATSLADVVVTSNIMESKMRNRTVTTELKPGNVYEDLGRGRTIVLMVFVTQVILISFVVTDIYASETHNCRDGSSGCPVVGTFGSWGFYVLGIFMACVFLLGPKTSFGQSEQNPAYWLQLLLAAKKTGAQCTWYDPVADKHKTRILSPNDYKVWARFFMSFLINGVGFHILVHALPIQVATQSSLTGVVFRAVGMMYLVDLDDTPGYTLRIVEAEKPAPKINKPIETAEPVDVKVDAAEQPMHIHNNAELNAEAQMIIDEARAKLEALSRGEIAPRKQLTAGVLLLAGAEIDNGIGSKADDVEEGGANESGAEDGGGPDESMDMDTGADDGGAEN
mmetsp:Transcript_26611/g.44409  ORF Transcript_26611/g.44409 Transcript_26611/m.44409 type:complete len:425 (+) Transcript_26611:321-1595(+)